MGGGSSRGRRPAKRPRQFNVVNPDQQPPRAPDRTSPAAPGEPGGGTTRSAGRGKPGRECWLERLRQPAASETRRGNILRLRPLTSSIGAYDSQDRVVGQISQTCQDWFNDLGARRARVVEVVRDDDAIRVRVEPVSEG